MVNKPVDVGHLAARFLSVKLPMGLNLDEVLIQGEGLRLENAPWRLHLPEPGTMEVRVGEESLAQFLDAKAPGGLRDFKIRLDGVINVQATATVILPIGVGAVCSLRIEEASKLYVDLIRVEAIGGAGVHNLVQKQLDGINPVLDTSELPLQASLDSVAIEKGWIVVKGNLAPR